MSESARIDKWLWYARLFKSRSIAARACTSRKVRINRKVVVKPNTALRIGDVVTVAQGPRIRVVQVGALGQRRGPAAEAVTLYQELEPAAPPRPRAGAGEAAAATVEPGLTTTSRERTFWARRQRGRTG